MPQTTYNLDVTESLAGQVVDAEQWSGRYETEEDIPYGRVVGLNSATGKARLPRHNDKLLGVSVYRASAVAYSGGIASGDKVAFLREGKAWCEITGTAPVVTALQRPNVSASTTTATNRGKLTSDATSAVAGSEIDAMPPAEGVKLNAASTLVLLDFDFRAGT